MTTASTLQPRDWRDRAACRDEDPDLFFPLSTDGISLTQAAKAQAVCNRCPVTRQCLEFALSKSEQWGVWGGTTGDERNGARRHLTRGTA